MKRHGYIIGGQVQGVGFRPFVYRAATRHRLTGHVGNTSDGVRVEVQGTDEALAAFAHALFASGTAFRSSRANESATSCPSVPARYGCASPVTALRSAASSCPRCASASAAPADRHRASGSSKTAARIFIRFFIIPSIL